MDTDSMETMRFIPMVQLRTVYPLIRTKKGTTIGGKAACLNTQI